MDERATDRTADGGVSGAADTWPLSAREAAAALGISERTVRRAIARGELPATRHAGVYRIASADLAHYRARRPIVVSPQTPTRFPTPHLIPFPRREEETVSALPRPLTPLIGRERELATVRTLVLDNGARLVTLTGPGGVGKTRLALAVGSEVAEAFPDGVWFVGLAPIRDPMLVASAIAQALGIREGSGGPLADRLAAFARDRRLLLLLDNFEHVVDAAPVIADLLEASPGLTVLATSRTRLRLTGEHQHVVPPLDLMDAGDAAPGEATTVPAAVRLFVARTQAVRADFALTPETGPTIAAICRRLDGLPLAIELAAVRVKVLPPTVLLARLEQRLPLLTGGGRDLPARLQTMRDAIAWSYDLLTEDEQALLRRLAVFDGAFTLEAAEAVADGGAGEALPGSAVVLDLVSSLVDHSLLRHEPGPGGVSRYLMLETIREFGLERLAETGEGPRTLDAHAAHFAALDGRLEPNRLGPDERFDDRLLRIEADYPNCRAALAHLAETGDAAGVLRLAGALAVFWHHRGHLREGRRWLEWALERTEDADPLWRGRALAGLSLIVWSQGDPERAASAAEAARAIAEAVDDKELLALAVHMLGLVEVVRGHWDQAERLMNEALSVEREIGTPGYGAMALTTLSEIAHRRGDAETSACRAEEALALFQAVGHASGAALALVILAGLAAERGDDRDARSAYLEALRLWASIGERWAIASAFSALAALAARHGQPEQAATLVGVVDARLNESGADLWLSDRRFYDKAVADARATLGEEQFARQRTAGRALALRQAIAVAEAVALPVPPERPFDPPLAMTSANALTAREQDVLRLLVEGRSNAEIAAALFVGASTVKTHVANILAKLGTPTRAAAATHAVRHGLV